MDRKKLKPIKTLSGNGEIRKAGKHFANCTYHLQVAQEIIISESLSDKQEIPGGYIVSGTVTISQQELLKPGILPGIVSGEIFTLHLSDGSRLETNFNPIRNPNNPINGIYSIHPAPGAKITGKVSGLFNWPRLR